ncbi:MAG TPA: DUF1080 domain-containing protein [Gemmataceae bacterium]|nr:DUF1080 domain-containing protein [Gemmataceae bacterium]
MRTLAATAVFLLALPCVRAADADQPNTLTPAEIADGWILLFDGKTTFGWKAEGEANVQDASLVLGGKTATRAISTTEFGNCEIRLEYKGRMQMAFDADGSTAALGAVSPSAWQTWHAKVQFDAAKSSGGVSFTSKVAHQVEMDVTYKCDHLRFRLEVPAGEQVSLRNIKLKPQGLKPLFNGKDLTGWKVFPGRKSQFTVTPEGWIHVKNGPGDLQTEGQWDDFVLQIDCLTNGDRLNSGVFFRCRPNEYQNGYEAQIHNGFTAEPTKEYTLEEYDPNTHQLMGKKKAKYTAIDYGTGAIYRRIPARFQAAKDRDWFTMTVIARGNHIATWVNGIQMVDWTDNRPPSENARNGCKLGKGPISLQGHDPTTDLNFRNIRLGEFPK